MQVHAAAKFVRISPRKVRLVVDHVRGRSVPQAEAILRNLSKRAATPVLKVIQSAAANAKQQHQIEKPQLRIAQITADSGIVMKRYRARAFGQGAMIRKRTSHISVILEGEKPVVQKKQQKKSS